MIAELSRGQVQWRSWVKRVRLTQETITWAGWPAVCNLQRLNTSPICHLSSHFPSSLSYYSSAPSFYGQSVGGQKNNDRTKKHLRLSLSLLIQTNFNWMWQQMKPPERKRDDFTFSCGTQQKLAFSRKNSLFFYFAPYSKSTIEKQYSMLSNVKLKNGSIYLCKAAIHCYPHDRLSQRTQHSSLQPVFIRAPNKAVSLCEAAVVVITESIRDVQTPQIPFLWETHWKGQKTNGYFGILVVAGVSSFISPR